MLEVSVHQALAEARSGSLEFIQHLDQLSCAVLLFSSTQTS